MPCYHPVTGWRSNKGRNSKTGLWPIVFDRKEGYADKEVVIPCGRCIGCRLERSRNWATRMVLEARDHANNCFVTLTYDDIHLPSNQSLNKIDIVKFLKRLRKHYGDQKIRYFQCGEYGDKTQRPHHHVCFFGFDFKDKTLWTCQNGYKYYRSATLEKLWRFGNSLITDLTFETAAYTARYITKKITGKMAESHYQGRQPEYVTMSRRSGIGKEFWNKFKQDIIVGDSIIIRNELKVRPGKYYDNLFHLEDPKGLERTKAKRVKKINPEETSYQRLRTREKSQELKMKKLKRSFENAS